MSLFLSYLKNTDGASAVEYGVLAAGITLAVVLAVFFLGDTLIDLFYDDLLDLIGSSGS